MAVHAENIQVSPETLTPGTEVNGWRILERLGTGGFGAAYRVEATARPGEFFALKMARTLVDERVGREIALLVTRAIHPHVVRLHAFGRWPHPATGFLYFVMDWVPGLPLHTWAEAHNPSVRTAVEKLATVAMVLQHLHAEGVLHRDLKPEHLLVREADGRPMLIDFGVGWYEGIDTLTSQGLAPGTPHLRSPEAVAFWRKHGGKPGTRYAYKPTDDVYALGVSAYRTLTGHWPFPPHMPRGELLAAIESLAPPAPSDVNRRLPRAVSDVILRMMARRPQDRFPSCAEAYVALVSALSFSASEALEAELFAWEAPPEAQRAPQGLERRVRLPEWPTLPGSSSIPPLKRPFALSGAFRRVGGVRAERLFAPAPAVPGAVEGTRTRGARGYVLWVAVVVAGLVGLGGLSALAAWPRPGEPEPVSLPVQTFPTPRVGEKSSALEGQKVALEPEWLEPLWTADPTPAVVAPATKPEDESSVKTQKQNQPAGQKVPETPEKKPMKKLLEGARKAAAVATTCAVLAGCASTPEVRPPPEPEECPPGSMENMKRLKIAEALRMYPGAEFINEGLDYFRLDSVPVREDDKVIWIVERVGFYNDVLKPGAQVIGKLIVRDRLYGRFTTLVNTDGKHYDVCLELNEVGTEKVPAGRLVGIPFVVPSSEPGVAHVQPNDFLLLRVGKFGPLGPGFF